MVNELLNSEGRLVSAVTLAQEDACGDLQIVSFELLKSIMQRLVVTGQRVSMEMIHEKLLRLIGRS